MLKSNDPTLLQNNIWIIRNWAAETTCKLIKGKSLFNYLFCSLTHSLTQGYTQKGREKEGEKWQVPCESNCKKPPAILQALKHRLVHWQFFSPLHLSHKTAPTLHFWGKGCQLISWIPNSLPLLSLACLHLNSIPQIYWGGGSPHVCLAVTHGNDSLCTNPKTLPVLLPGH